MRDFRWSKVFEDGGARVFVDFGEHGGAFSGGQVAQFLLRFFDRQPFQVVGHVGWMFFALLLVHNFAERNLAFCARGRNEKRRGKNSRAAKLFLGWRDERAQGPGRESQSMKKYRVGVI